MNITDISITPITIPYPFVQVFVVKLTGELNLTELVLRIIFFMYNKIEIELETDTSLYFIAYC